MQSLQTAAQHFSKEFDHSVPYMTITEHPRAVPTADTETSGPSKAVSLSHKPRGHPFLLLTNVYLRIQIYMLTNRKAGVWSTEDRNSYYYRYHVRSETIIAT